MVTGNGNTVELRHVLGGIFENITNNTHGHGRRINVGITNHEFLQDIILDGALQNLTVYALFDACTDEEGQDGENRTVHGHGYGHLVQRNTIKKDVHIQHGAHGHASLTDIADYAGIIGIVAAVGWKVKCNGQPLLAGRQVSLIKCIGFFSGREPCILPDSPWTEYVHGGVRSTEEWRNTAHEIQMIAFLIDVLRIERRNRNTFQRSIIEVIILFTCSLFQVILPQVVITTRMVFQIEFCKVRIRCHIILPPLP